MAAYIVFIKEHEHDTSAMDTYAKAVPASFAGHELKPLSFYGKVEGLEGPPLMGAVVVEFPTFEAAKAWYDSAEYREARKHRFQGADYRVFIVEGT
ncbi:MAG: DUF1330 domain-containing protein [Novosphingobium sp.]|nr:DUF1330 domain-containing protein [Novosphingobium sp.]